MSTVFIDESRVLMSDLKDSNGEDTTEVSGEEKAALIAREVQRNEL